MLEFKPTKNGKWVRRPKRECPDCLEVGKIVDLSVSNKYFCITRKCLNPQCPRNTPPYGDGKPYHYYHYCYRTFSSDYTIRELDECEKWIEGGLSLETLRLLVELPFSSPEACSFISKLKRCLEHVRTVLKVLRNGRKT